MRSLPRWITDTFRVTEPAALAPPDHYDPADVAVMLREIGIAMVEVSYPVQYVERRLLDIARSPRRRRRRQRRTHQSSPIRAADNHIGLRPHHGGRSCPRCPRWS